MHRLEWQTLTWVLVSAIVVYVLLGPNLISWALAVVGVMGAVVKAGIARCYRRQVARTGKETS